MDQPLDIDQAQLNEHATEIGRVAEEWETTETEAIIRSVRFTLEMIDNLNEAASWIEHELPASQAEELAYLLSTDDVKVHIEETVSIKVEIDGEP